MSLFLNFLIFFNFHISCIPIVWSYWVSDNFKIELSLTYYIFLFFSTQFVYTYDRFIFRDPADPINFPERTQFNLSLNKFGIFWFLLSFTGTLITVIWLSIENWILFISLAFLTLSYLLLKSIEFDERIKGYLKIFILSTVWSSILIISPIAQKIKLINFDTVNMNFKFAFKRELDLNFRNFFYLFFYTFLLFNLLSIYFDKRDQLGDIQTNKPNIHKFISEKKFHLIIIILPLILLIMNLFIYEISIFYLIGIYYLIIYKIITSSTLNKKNISYDLLLDLPLLVFPLIDIIL